MEINGSIGDYFLPKPPPTKNTYLDQAAFLKLLVTQLSTQNPMEPMGDRDFFAQMAQLGTVQGIDRIGSGLQLSQASSMIGKTVTVSTGTDFGWGTYTGRVTSVEVADQKVYIRIDRERYALDKVVKIT